MEKEIKKVELNKVVEEKKPVVTKPTPGLSKDKVSGCTCDWTKKPDLVDRPVRK